MGIRVTTSASSRVTYSPPQPPPPPSNSTRSRSFSSLSVYSPILFDQEYNIIPIFPTFDRLPLLKTVFIKMSSIAALLQAAEYIERRERGMRNPEKNGWKEIEQASDFVLISSSCLHFLTA